MKICKSALMRRRHVPISPWSEVPGVTAPLLEQQCMTKGSSNEGVMSVQSCVAAFRSRTCPSLWPIAWFCRTNAHRFRHPWRQAALWHEGPPTQGNESPWFSGQRQERPHLRQQLVFWRCHDHGGYWRVLCPPPSGRLQTEATRRRQLLISCHHLHVTGRRPYRARIREFCHDLLPHSLLSSSSKHVNTCARGAVMAIRIESTSTPACTHGRGGQLETTQEVIRNIFDTRKVSRHITSNWQDWELVTERQWSKRAQWQIQSPSYRAYFWLLVSFVSHTESGFRHPACEETHRHVQISSTTHWQTIRPTCPTYGLSYTHSTTQTKIFHWERESMMTSRTFSVHKIYCEIWDIQSKIKSLEKDSTTSNKQIWRLCIAEKFNTECIYSKYISRFMLW